MGLSDINSVRTNREKPKIIHTANPKPANPKTKESISANIQNLSNTFYNRVFHFILL